jgi:predicted GNAT family acetyltransferase
VLGWIALGECVNDEEFVTGLITEGSPQAIKLNTWSPQFFALALTQSAMDLVVEKISSAKTFLAQSEYFRNENPIETNAIGSLAISAAKDTAADPDRFWWLVLRDKEVVGIASSNATHPLKLSPMIEGAAEELARMVWANNPTFLGVSGPEEVAREFILGWCALSEMQTNDFSLHERYALYVLGDHSPLTTVSGKARISNVYDLDLLVKWMREFEHETGGIIVGSQAELQARVLASTFVIWEIDNRPVAMSRLASTIVHPGGLISRIGVVYTPPNERGNGYGAAVTSSMIEHLQKMGCSTITLQTDSDYEKSNRIYQRLGFLAVGEAVVLNLKPTFA